MNRILVLFICLIGVANSQLLAQSSISETGFYRTDVLQEIRIQLPYDNWANMLDSLRYNGDELLLGSAQINGQSFENVGVRYRASRSFTPGQKRQGLFIKLNHINPDQHLERHQELVLSDALRDPSMVREVLSFEIARKYMPAPAANFASVYINGDFYGLLVNIESVGDALLEKYFANTNGPLYFAKSYDPYLEYPAGCKQNVHGSLEHDRENCYDLNFEDLAQAGYGPLMELTKLLEEGANRVESVLDVDQVLWMLAFNNVLVNLNSYSGRYSQNYYLYRDAKGHFHPIIWDLNLAFGSYKNIDGGSDLRLKQLQELSPTLHMDSPSKPLISQLLADPLNRKIYLAHMRDILFDFFVSGEFEKRAKALQAMIKPLVEKDSNLYYEMEQFETSLTTTIGKRSKIPGLLELMEKRQEYLEKHPLLAVLPPPISDTKVQERAQFSRQRVETFQVSTNAGPYAKRVKLMYRFDDSERFKEALMLDDGGNNDGEAKDGIFGITIVPQGNESMLEYYIVAENASIVGFDPPNYMWERHIITLDELNK